MSEICLACLNEALGTHDTARQYLLSLDRDLCECCGKFGPVVIRRRLPYILLDTCRELRDNIRTYPERARRK